jgi:hypothetical protein
MTRSIYTYDLPKSYRMSHHSGLQNSGIERKPKVCPHKVARAHTLYTISDVVLAPSCIVKTFNPKWCDSPRVYYINRKLYLLNFKPLFALKVLKIN